MKVAGLEIVRGLHNLRPDPRGCVATIGNFDGVHAGHTAIIHRIADHAGDRPVSVVTFEPLPREFFLKEAAPARLTRLRDKLLALAALPVDRVVILPFDAHLAAMPAETFVADLLVERLGVKRLVVGDDFHFGRGRAGNFESLTAAAHEHGFAAECMEPFLVDGERVSSTAIRESLATGDMARAQRLLGRPYVISGRVVEGDRRGRTLGFPTANIPLGARAMAVRGVFAVRVRLDDDEKGDGFIFPGGDADHHQNETWENKSVPFFGVANVGHRPTIATGGQRIEVHLFDFEGDLYGKRLCVELMQRLRDERRFPSLDALREQIELDAEAARAALGVTVR